MKRTQRESPSAWLGTAAVLATLLACGQPHGQEPPAGRGAAFSYEPYARLLLDFVDARGWVDYAGLQASPQDLEAFVESLAELDPKLYESWDDPEKIAFWINAYNALTLKAIVDHYPIRASWLRSLVYPRNSIRQIPGVWTDLRWIVMGRAVTLDGIEHEILRRQFAEPRIHMALVCAAKGCPPLRWEPYRGERLDAQLEDQTVRFLRDPNKLRLDPEGGRVSLSSIFEWFGQDFVAHYGTDDAFQGRPPEERAVLRFVADRLEGEAREFLLAGRYEVHYLDYDWSLNEQEPKEARRR